MEKADWWLFTAAAHLKSLRQKKAEQEALLERKWKGTVAQMDDQLRSLSLGEFVDRYEGSKERALREIVQNTIKRAPMGSEELIQRWVCPGRGWGLVCEGGGG